MSKLFSSGMFRNNGIGRRMIVSLILFSSLMTAVITAFELYLDYRHDISGIESRFDFISESYLPTLAESVWVADAMQIQTQLAGLSRLQDVEAIGISIDGVERWGVGAVKSARTIERDIAITRSYRGEMLTIGTLKIVGSVDNVLGRLLDKLVTILVSNAIKTTLVSIFMLLIFQLMVGRHLEHIAHYLRQLGKGATERDDLVLERKAAGVWRPDALDYVTNSINEMRRGIAESQSRIVALNTTLESRVEERTMQLQETNSRLSAAMQDLEEVSKAKNLFFSRMSHELRTPLNAICGFSRLLQREPLNDDQLESVEWIVKAGDHLLQLINDLLDLSRIESGKLVVDIRPFNLADILAEAISLTQSEREYRQITLNQTCDGEFSVLVDRTRLNQVLVNLLSNAIKYNRAGGSVRLSCEAVAGGRLRVAVTDTGYGIPVDKQSLVFQPFERLGAEHSGIEGTGTGLALSKSLAEVMSSTLGFTSTPGDGSTFWIDLPLSTDVAVAESAMGYSRARARQDVRILYVEDNIANLKLIEKIFKRYPGYSLSTATDGEAGLVLARRELPDLILLDIHLPLRNGYQLLAELRRDSSTQSIPVIALTADAMPDEIRQGLEAGFYRYLTKPIDQQLLMETITQALAAAR